MRKLLKHINIVLDAIIVIGLIASVAGSVHDCNRHSECERTGRVVPVDCKTDYSSLADQITTRCDWRCVHTPELDR